VPEVVKPGARKPLFGVRLNEVTLNCWIEEPTAANGISAYHHPGLVSGGGTSPSC
jgi:hypothetical protein